MRSSRVSSKPMTMVAVVLEAGFEEGALGGEVFGDGVFEFGVAAAEVLGEDFGASAGDPADACGFEARGGFGVGELRVVGEVEELGDGEGVELQCVAVAVTNGGEEVAVVVEREMRVEAAVECGEVAAEREQLVELREDRFAGGGRSRPPGRGACRRRSSRTGRRRRWCS